MIAAASGSAPDVYQLTPDAAHLLVEAGDRVVVTGASGWLGTATLALLHAALGDTFDDRVCCFGSAARSLTLQNGVKIEQRPLAEIVELAPAPTIVLHLAFLTKDRAEAMQEAEFRAANAAISATVRSALDKIGARSVFVASSGAARSARDDTAPDAMRIYGEMKLRDEEHFAAWATAARTVVLTRIFNVAGPFINKHQAYALASFIADALAGRTIVVRAPHRVVRGYVAIRELMSLVVLLLCGPAAGVVRFDTGGTAMELEEVALAVSEHLGGRVDRAAIASDRIDAYVGDPTAYERLLRRHGIPTVPFSRQIAETAASMIASDAALG